MSNKTFIKGKDTNLEDSIEQMSAKLEALGFHIEEVSALNPVANVYSVHVRDKECPMLFTNGKGTCKKSALASALGEFFERLSCNYFFADYYLGEQFSKGPFVHYPNERWFVMDDEMPEELLEKSLWDFYDPDGDLLPEHIFELNSGSGERGVCALAFTRLRDKREILFPINLIANLYVSNGMSAGNTMAEARVQALCEIFERYVKNKIISEGLSLPQIPQSHLEKFPQAKEAIEKLTQHGYNLRVADASLGGKYPVISVTLMNPNNGSVFASFGSHPCFEVALERTVTELLQGRSLEQLDGFSPPSFDMDEVSDNHNLVEHFINATGLIGYDFFKKRADFEFVSWNMDADTQSQFEHLSQLIHKEGRDIFIADYEHLGVYACRIIVPGMSEIYPLEDVEWNNNNGGASLRQAILSLKNLDKKGCKKLLNDLEYSSAQDTQKVCELIGILPDENTLWESLSVGELKGMLSLAMGDLKGAREWNDWFLEMQDTDEKKTREARCLQALLAIEMDEEKEFFEYEESLRLIFGAQSVVRAEALMRGSEVFSELHSPGLSLEGFKRHQKLLDAYAKVHKAKEKQYAQNGLIS